MADLEKRDDVAKGSLEEQRRQFDERHEQLKASLKKKFIAEHTLGANENSQPRGPKILRACHTAVLAVDLRGQQRCDRRQSQPGARRHGVENPRTPGGFEINRASERGRRTDITVCSSALI